MENNFGVVEKTKNKGEKPLAYFLIGATLFGFSILMGKMYNSGEDSKLEKKITQTHIVGKQKLANNNISTYFLKYVSNPNKYGGIRR